MTSIDIVVDSAHAKTISPDLWGIFLEDLNFALDGGLNAELVLNGDFEFADRDGRGWGPLTGWGVFTPGSLRTVFARSDKPLHPANSNYLRIEGPTTLRNEGWDGVGVGSESRFRLRVAARLVSGEGNGALSARIATGARELTGPVTFDFTSSEWTWYDVQLTGFGEGRGTLEIDVPDNVVVDLDAVSLRPLAVDGTPAIFREDLLEAMAELKPSFVRFPGGCLAHGVGLDNVYDWKGSIGDTHARRQLSNPWGYHQSRAIGYYEFFLLCERLGATAVPVVAAGVCCQNTPGGPRAVPIEEMPEYIQDVLDLVEFATGDVNTTWGDRRAQLGHPEPFGLRYLGVGNEDEITADFRDRYAMIERAVSAAYPDVAVIGTTGPASAGRDFDLGWKFAREQGTALVDEHYYEAPFWFHQNLNRYDAYDRSGPGVYLGEYAARSNRVRSALAEAAYMIGLERNSDIVRLASYAPLIARIGNSQWRPDLIYFDAEQVLPSASYFVQKLFSTERGTTSHAVHGDLGGEIPVQLRSHGEITFRIRDGRFTLSDIQLNGTARDPLEVSPGEQVSMGDVALDEFELSFVATRHAGETGFVVDIGGDGPDLAPSVEVAAWRNDHTTVKLRQFGISGDATDGCLWRGFATDVPVNVRITLIDGRIRVWLGDELVHDIVPSTTPEKRIVVGALSRPTADGDIEHVLRFVNATDNPLPVAVRLDERRATGAHGTILAGAGPDEGAAFQASPTTPSEQKLEIVDGSLVTELAPWSFAVAVVASRTIE